MSLALVVTLVAFLTGVSGSPGVTMRPETEGPNFSSSVPDTVGEAHFFEKVRQKHTVKYMILFYCNHYYVKTFFVHSTKASAQVKTELSKPSSTNIRLQSQWVSVVLKIRIINMFRLGDKIVQTSTAAKFLRSVTSRTTRMDGRTGKD